jgi:hypothetical protein
MVLNRIKYDQRRYEILNQYMESRRRGIERTNRAAMKRLDDAYRLAEQRGDFWLEMIRREIDDELDAIIYSDLMATNEAINELLRDFPTSASKPPRQSSPFTESAEFLKTFEDLI